MGIWDTRQKEGLGVEWGVEVGGRGGGLGERVEEMAHAGQQAHRNSVQ